MTESLQLKDCGTSEDDLGTNFSYQRRVEVKWTEEIATVSYPTATTFAMVMTTAYIIPKTNTAILK
jgi:hypothetical protein